MSAHPSASLEAKEQIRQAIDIVDLIGSRVALRRQGRGFVGLCPWHDDSSPSLQVNPDRQLFKCWVCNIGGDIFSFVMRVEGVDFAEALQMLADRAGIAIDRGSARLASQTAQNRQALYHAMAWAEQEYHRCLVESPDAEPARKYLAQRHISPESMRTFRIGYSPDRWDWILTRAQSSAFSSKMLEQIGIAVPRPSGGGYYDRFRGRVLFPIRDVQSRPIALGGRILPHADQDRVAKYINSPETVLFSKSDHLYGLDIAKKHLEKERRLVVVEGYTDCVIAHQHGVGNVVAVLGTALGPRHVRLLSRFAETITLTLDGDQAGQRRASEILELFVAMEVDLRILTLPENLDPCDFLVSQGSDAFRQLLADAVDAVEHKIQMVTQGLDPVADTHRAHLALEEILQTVARAPRLSALTQGGARLREQQVISRLARRFLVSEVQLRQRLTELRRPARRKEEPEQPACAGGGGRPDPWDRALLELVLARPDWIESIAAAVPPDALRSAACQTIYSLCAKLAQLGATPAFERLILECEDPDVRSLLFELDETSRAKAGSDRQLELDQILESYRRRKEDAQHHQKVAALRTEGSEAGQLQALDDLIAALRPRHRRSDPTDG